MPTHPTKNSRLAAALLLGSVLGAGGALWGLAPTFAANVPPSLSTVPVTPQAGFGPLVTRVKPAVVEIATIGSGGEESRQQQQQLQQMPDMNGPQFNGPMGDMLRRYFGQQGQGQQGEGGRARRNPEQRALGSGFIIDPAGYIVTNNHVVDGAREVSVTLTDGDKYKAKVIGRDQKTDLALLKIEAGHNLPYVTFGDSDNAHEGDWVIAVGNPYGLGGTVTAGIVSAHGRNINEGPYDDFMQIDASINPGNSGGPVFNQSGQVIGIDTAIYSPTGGSVGIGFAIPSNVAKTIVNQLRTHGKIERGWLGIAMQPLTPALAKAAGLASTHGVLVDSITEGSPASKSDLHQGDVITGFDGKPVNDARDLAMAVAGTPAGKTVSVSVIREGKTRAASVTIRAQEDSTRQASAAAPKPTESPVGLSLQELTPDLRQQLNLPATAGGVVVGEVTPGSAAEESGVEAGDVIQRVGGNAVHTPQDVAQAIRTARQEKKDAVALLVLRDGQSAYLGLQLEA